MKHIVLLLATSLLAVTSARAGTIPTTEQVVEHHMRSGNAQQVEEVMHDYAANAILVAPDGVHKGKQAIRASYEQLASGPKSTITADRKVFEGEVGYVAWTMNAGQPGAVHGTDTFIVRKGKIVVQTVTIFQPNQQ